jgi:hypothetical protein
MSQTFIIQLGGARYRTFHWIAHARFGHNHIASSLDVRQQRFSQVGTSVVVSDLWV